MRSPLSFPSKDAMDMFLMELEAKQQRIMEDLKHLVAMNLSPDEEQQFLEATHCWICEESLGNDHVWDHNHMSGDFRGAAHQAWVKWHTNINCKICGCGSIVNMAEHSSILLYVFSCGLQLLLEASHQARSAENTCGLPQSERVRWSPYHQQSWQDYNWCHHLLYGNGCER